MFETKLEIRFYHDSGAETKIKEYSKSLETEKKILTFSKLGILYNLISGFKESINKAEFKERLAASKLEVTLNREVVEAGDVFYIPAGRIHTIGKGILIAEIQQTSDVTYRIFDFDREDIVNWFMSNYDLKECVEEGLIQKDADLNSQ